MSFHPTSIGFSSNAQCDCSVTAGEVFPPEIWQGILDKVEHSKDLHSCSESCLLIADLLEHSKQYWAFELILPLILPHLDATSVLKSRLVCSKWQKAVDRFVENCPNNRPYKEDDDRHPLGQLNSNDVDFYRPNSIYKLVWPLRLSTNWAVERLISPHRLERLQNCRIIGGTVVMGRGWFSPHTDNYWNAAWTFLEAYGSRIPHLCLQNFTTFSERSPDALYQYTQAILTKCRKIRRLELSGGNLQLPIRATNGTTSCVKNAIRQGNPLPQLPELESLLMGIGLNQGIQDAMLQEYGPQLKWIVFTLYQAITDDTLRTLKNLTELYVQVHNEGRKLEDRVNNENLRRLLLIPAQGLQKLTLHLCYQVHLKLDTLLDLCDHFPVLKALCVCGDRNMKLYGHLAPAGRKIRSLKWLEFLDVIGVQSFNFLECFPSLEQLHLKGIYVTTAGYARFRNRRNVPPKPKYGIKSKVRESVKIRELLYPEREEDYVKMYESNVWSICPHLKRFTFQYKWIGPWFMEWSTGNNRSGNGGHRLESLVVRTYTREELWTFYGF